MTKMLVPVDEPDEIEDHCPECGQFESECECVAQCASCGKMVDAEDLDGLGECPDCWVCEACDELVIHCKCGES